MSTNRMTSRLHMAACTVAVLLVVGGIRPLQGQEKKKAEDQADGQVQASEMVTNLDNPCGVAVHPETGHVFIASRLALYRFVPSSEADAEVTGTVNIEIAGYSTDVYGEGPKFNIGPLGVAFLDNEHLVVGGGGRKDPEELVRIYKISPEPPEEWRQEDAAEFTLGPIPPSDQTSKGEGNFYGVAASENAIFVTCNGDDTKGWVAKAEVQDGKPGELTLAIATKVATNVDAPVPATFNPDGDLVIGQMGEISKPGDSLLTIYNPETGELKQQWETGLSDITGIAYSPTTGNIYATDFAWLDAAKTEESEKQGGLYRLEISGDSVEATRIMRLDKPTSLAFDKQGRLYVTVFGTQSEEQKEAEKSPGKLLRIDAGL